MDQKNSIQQAEKDYKKQQKAVNEAFKQAQGVYDNQVTQLQQMQPQYEQSIISGYDVQAPILQQGAQSAQESLGLQRQATEAGRESALSAARRQYQEGLQRSQQLFGGVGGSSTGQASSEYLGAQTQRTMGETRQAAQQSLAGIGQQERAVQANLTNQLQQLEVKKQQDLLKTRDLFRQELNSINSQKASLGLNKANAQLQALSDFNARKRQLEDFYTEQKAARENYAFQLQQQASYGLFNKEGTGTTGPLQSLSGFGTNNQGRSQYLVSLIGTKEGQKSLQDRGFIVSDNFTYNPSTGEGYDINGIRFPDYAIGYANSRGESPYDYTKQSDYESGNFKAKLNQPK
jgi:hypothetical protein